MIITYLNHSGFFVELDKTLLLFDYYKGDIPALNREKRLYVFVSHRHGDHFNPEIFELEERHPDIHYVLSSDIWKKRVPEELRKRTVHLKPRTEWEEKDIKVRTLKSTDEGVAFLVEAEGKHIYHAGDLNDWHWKEESKEWNQNMAANFKKFIEPVRGRNVDAAFIPLDPRQEENYTLGMDYFLEIVEAKKVYPMHTWGDYGIIRKWFEEHENHPKKACIVKISEPGEKFEQ